MTEALNRSCVTTLSPTGQETLRRRHWKIARRNVFGARRRRHRHARFDHLCAPCERLAVGARDFVARHVHVRQRQRFRMVRGEKREHAFAHRAAEVEQVAGIARAHEQALLQRAAIGIGDLGDADTAVPAIASDLRAPLDPAQDLIDEKPHDQRGQNRSGGRDHGRNAFDAGCNTESRCETDASPAIHA
jgi:hypothetical protein